MNIEAVQPSQPSQPASQPAQPASQPRLYHFGSVATNRARPSQNYYTHGHPSPVICGGTFELRGQFGLRRGELEIGPNFGPLPAPWRPSLAPTGARLALVKVKPSRAWPPAPSIRTRTAPTTPILVYTVYIHIYILKGYI